MDLLRPPSVHRAGADYALRLNLQPRTRRRVPRLIRTPLRTTRECPTLHPAGQALAERFHRTYRTEVLDVYVFASVSEVRELTTDRLDRDNTHGIDPISWTPNGPDLVFRSEVSDEQSGTAEAKQATPVQRRVQAGGGAPHGDAHRRRRWHW